MKAPLIGIGVEDITWPDQVVPRGRKASSTGDLKPQTSNLKPQNSTLKPRRPSQRHKIPPPGMPSFHPHSAQHQLARACAVGSVPGSHTHTSRTRRTRAADPDCRPKGRAAAGVLEGEENPNLHRTRRLEHHNDRLENADQNFGFRLPKFNASINQNYQLIPGMGSRRWQQAIVKDDHAAEQCEMCKVKYTNR